MLVTTKFIQNEKPSLVIIASNETLLGYSAGAWTTRETSGGRCTVENRSTRTSVPTGRSAPSRDTPRESRTISCLPWTNKRTSTTRYSPFLYFPVCVCVCLCVCLSVCLCVSFCLYEVNKQKDFYYSRRGWSLPLRFLSFCPSHPLYISIFPFLLFKKERICFFFCIDVSAGFLRQCPNSTRLLELFSRNM